MVYWITFPGEISQRRWYHIRHDVRILKGPLDKLIGRDNYDIFKAGQHPLLETIKKEFLEDHSLQGTILEIYDVKHIVFLKTSLENFKSFTRHRNRHFQSEFDLYEVEPETILRSEKLIQIRTTKTQKREIFQTALRNLARIINAMKNNKAKEEFPTYVNRIINGHNNLIPEVTIATKKLSKQIKKLDDEIRQLHNELMELWKNQRVDL